MDIWFLTTPVFYLPLFRLDVIILIDNFSIEVRDRSLLIPWIGAEGNIFFSLKKIITHSNFASSFHTPYENLPKIDNPTCRSFLCFDSFYDIYEPN